MKHDPVAGWCFLQVPGIQFLPQSCTILDYDFNTHEYLLVLAKDMDLDAVYIVQVSICDWQWNGNYVDMKNIQQGHILHSFDLSSKPDNFLVNSITQSVTVSSSRDISIYCL
jgi:putative alpha-1,2-mannosidase